MITKAQLNDEDLIQKHLAHNPNLCFETLYNRYVSKVYRRCLSLIKDHEKAQDFTQDIFMRTFERLNRFEAKSSFSTWLYSISFNYCMDQIKKANRLSMTCLEDHHADQLADEVEGDDWEERAQLLSQTLQGLAPKEASLLQMKYQQGLNIQQIGQQLNLNQSAVKMRLQRSRQKARQYYCARLDH
jgi:RNA polymerase sigma factor (sigma-70 family)